jgi:membrane-anchored protein YejM (alkaline phosphatase superfamily)
MERRRFVLSWGRKIFFGLGWPLLCLLGLVYLKSGVIPKDTTSLFYYFLTNIGFFGLVTSIIYFVLYVPFALIFPTYYFVRMWSAFLILLASSAVLLDGMVFGEFRFHINQLIVSIFTSQGPAQIFNGSVAPYVVTAGVIVFLFFVLWIRGEWLWRVMQRKFSNPVKNWYFPFIIICLGISHLIWNNQRTSFYGNEITLGTLFPLNYQEIFYPKVHSTSALGKANLNYPNKELKCISKTFPHVVFIVMESFGTSSISEMGTPFVRHLQQHGMNFNMHLSGGGTQEDSLFRLIYGIPALYRPEAPDSAMVGEFKKAGYEIAVFSEKSIPGFSGAPSDLATWIDTRKASESVQPAFLFFNLSASSPEEMDLKLKDTVSSLQSGKLLTGSTIILTGTNLSEWDTVPFTLIFPDREKGEWSHRTSHYDVAPTLMKNILNCKTSPKAYSYGKELREPPARDWEIFGNEKSFRIVDFTNHNIIESDWQGRIISGDRTRSDLVLKASREISRFYRR